MTFKITIRSILGREKIINLYFLNDSEDYDEIINNSKDL